MFCYRNTNTFDYRSVASGPEEAIIQHMVTTLYYLSENQTVENSETH